MMKKIKLTRANKSVTLKALAPYYYQQRALGHSTQEVGKLILKINALPADKKATFSTEEIFLMRKTINRLNARLSRHTLSTELIFIRFALPQNDFDTCIRRRNVVI